MHMQILKIVSKILYHITKLVKENLDTLVPVIMKIVNLSLVNGIFAKDWKVTILGLLL